MIQILGLRPYTDSKTGKEKLSEKFFERGWRAESIEHLFASYPEILKKIPQDEQWNLFFTVADCHEETGRKLKLQHHIAIDVDKMFVKQNDDGSIDETCFEPVIKCVEKVTKVPRGKMGILFSGHGLWFYIRVASPISDDEYFKQTRLYYKALADTLNIEFKKNYLTCETDPTAWSGARLSRMPGTMNIKKDKPKRLAYVVQPNIEEMPFDIKQLSGVPEIAQNHHINIENFRKDFPPADVKEILHPERGCNFLYWSMTHQKEVNEAQWFATLGITGRFPNGREHAHNFSKDHPHYNYDDTELKLNHALFYGPRTCKGIEAISDKCRNCVHFNSQKGVISPIMIRGEDYIESEPYGFHTPKKTEYGMVPGKPDPDGLARYYIKKNGSVIHVAGVMDLWKYTGSYFKAEHAEVVQAELDGMFKPAENTAHSIEAYKKICNKTIKPRDFFIESVDKKVNFKNGVLDVTTRELVPHSPEFGFTSVLSCEYDSLAIAPNWVKFLNDVMNNDEEIIAVLQEFIGYAIAQRDCSHQVALFLLGTGSNGKSVFVTVIQTLFGKEACSSVNLTELQHDTKRAMLDGKLLNISEENDFKTGMSDSSAFKNMVAGGTITAKNVYERPYVMTNTAKFIILLNKLPRTQDDTRAFFRRPLIIPFNKVFSTELGNKDVHLTKKLLLELPGIMNWALEGYDRLQKNGVFTQSSTIKKYVDEYKKDSSDMLRFLEECVTLEEHATASRDEIYACFRDWADQENYDAGRTTKQKIYSVIRDYYKEEKGKYPEEGRVGARGTQTRAFKGIKLHPPRNNDGY